MIDVWQDCIDLWQASLRCANTRKNYTASLQDFQKFFGGHLSKATRSDVARWIDSMRKRGLASSTVNTRATALSSFYRFAKEEYTVRDERGKEIPLTYDNPAARRSLRQRVERFGKSRALSGDETKKLLSVIDRSTIQGRRDYALFLGYVLMGKRNSEWRKARVGSFELHGNQVMYRWSGKGRQDVLSHVPPPVWDAVIDHVNPLDAEDTYVFRSLRSQTKEPLSGTAVSKLLKTYAKRAGLAGERIYPHMLRHTAAHLRKEAGDTTDSIQDFLGHQSPVTTRIYLQKLDGTVDQSWQKVARIIGVEA